MAESFPYSFEPASDDKDKETKRRFVSLERLGGELVRPPRPDSQPLELFRPIGGDALHPHAKPDVVDQQGNLKPKMPKPVIGEHGVESPGQAVAENLAGLAAEQVEAVRRMQELGLGEPDDEEEDDAKAKRKRSEGSPALEHEAAALPEGFGTHVYSAESVPEAAAAAEFGERLGAIEGVGESGTNGLGPEQEQISAQTAAANAEFQSIAQHEELARLAAMHMPETSSILGDGFSEIVRNSLGGNAPRTARFTERAPGEPPIDNSAGGNRPPNFPPTAEGGMWGNGWSNPNSVSTPFGAAVDLVTWAGLVGLAMRERFHNTQRAITEASLFGGELLLAAGLVGEHFLARRRDNEIKRQFEGQIGSQNKVLSETNQALRQTRREFDNLAAAHTATEEQLNRVSSHILPAAEAATGLGPAAAATGTELADRAGRTREMSPQPQSVAERELVRELEHSRGPGETMSRNPAVRDAAELAGVAAAQGLETRRHEASEDEVGFNGDTLRLETRHERLQRDLADNSSRQKAGDTDVSDLSELLPPQSTNTLTIPLSAQPSARWNNQNADRSKLASSWVWGTVALCALAAVLFAVFVR